VLDVLEARGIQVSASQEAFYQRLVKHLGQVFVAFEEMIPALARSFPGHTIVVRPHPSEDHDRWRKALAGVDNAKVIYQGSAEPWLSAADAVIHNASTIGVEAFLLDRPVFSYMPVTDEVFNRPAHLPNMISTRAHSLENLLNEVRAAVEGLPLASPETAERKRFVRRYVANASGSLAAERIVQVLSELHEARPPRRPDNLSYADIWLRMTARQYLSRLRHIVRLNRRLYAYMDQKFPELTLQEVKDQLKAIAQAAGRDSNFSVVPHPYLKNCYTISAVGRSRIASDEAARREPQMTARAQ
jgi:CDP-glycerol glycerophosphotransferase (TagB/SpsB family)